MYEITIQRTFSAAHALQLPDATLEPLHGHDWRLSVTVASDKLDKMGTVMDFHLLERMLNVVVDPWHNANLNEVDPFMESDRLVINPSAERVAEVVAVRLSAALAGEAGGGGPESGLGVAGVRLREVAVGEAPGCTARYRPRAGRPRK